MPSNHRTSRLPAIVEERRAVKLDRSAVDEQSRAFTGHAAVYNQRAAIGDPLKWGFFEQIARGAFDKSLADGDVVQLADHDPAKPIARMSAGTLRLASDATGLAVDSEIVDTSYGSDLIANVRAGNVAGMSFGFQVVKDEWTTETVERNDGLQAEAEVRTLLEVRLIEVSTTPFPAYSGTDAGLRSIRAARLSVRARGGPEVLEVSDGQLAALGAELRAGAALSAANLATLQQVLDLLVAADTGVDTADAALDSAQSVLAALMGVADPDPPKPGEMEMDGGFPVDLAIRYRILADTLTRSNAS